MSRWVIALSLIGSACGSCAPRTNRLVPMVLRPDTRNVVAVEIDSIVGAQSLSIFLAASPNEAAVCYTGRLRDTTGAFQVLQLTGVTEAVSDSANPRAVWFGNTHAGCGPKTVAIGHSHPPDSACDHSDTDAYLLFGYPLALVSIVWCPDGELNYLWQDGTRTHGHWAS